MSETFTADASAAPGAADASSDGTAQATESSAVTMSNTNSGDASATERDATIEPGAALPSLALTFAQAASSDVGAATESPVGTSGEAGDAAQADPGLSGTNAPATRTVPRAARKRPRPGERRMQILQMLAEMLESPQADRVTTAALAARLQVSEAALYRHFASKAQMFEGLIGFIEQTLFGLINQITTSKEDGFEQLRAIFTLLLTFAERNPGMTRVLVGDALVTEADRLQERINQLTDRLELSIKQCFRTLVAEGRLPPETDPAARANLMMSCVQGRWLRFAKGGFKRGPTDGLEAQAAVLIHA